LPEQSPEKTKDQIIQTVSEQSPEKTKDPIIQTASEQSPVVAEDTIHQAVPDEFKPFDIKAIQVLGETKSAEAKPGLNPARLLQTLSFTHLVEPIKIEDPLKRAFYEIECVKGTWSTRELHRQIGSLYFERSGLSKDKKKLS